MHRDPFEGEELMCGLVPNDPETMMHHHLGSAAASEPVSSPASIGAAWSPPTYQLPPSIYPIPAQLRPDAIHNHFNRFAPDHTFYQSPPHPPSFRSQHDSPSVSSSCTTNSVVDDETSLNTTSVTRPSFTSGQSPRLIDLLLPGTDLSATPPDFKDYNPEPSKVLYQPSGGSYTPDPQLTPLEDDVEDIIRQPEPADAWGVRLASPSPSNSSTSTEGFIVNPSEFMPSQPRFHPASPEMLMMRFDQQTCGILSVKDGPTENPWRTLLWPLARDSPALYHAIHSMTAFHSSKEQSGLRVVGMEHMRRSIRHLADGLKTMRTETALATTLVLAFAESWDQHISSGTEHLRGAKILLNQAIGRHRQQSLNAEELVRLKFLSNTWIYMDVIARLTSLDDDDSDCLATVLTSPYGPAVSYQSVDPLMGCASTLFPLIGRVASLIRKVRMSISNSINIISQANELKTALENWQASSVFEAPEDPTSEIQHSLQTAEAYRWATLLYLHQAVPEIPSRSASQLAEKVLVYLATVPLTSRTVIVQIYPLLAAGCEVTGDEDRTWVKNRWAAMMNRMLIGNLDRCWEVIQEVWNRRDADEAERNPIRFAQDAMQTHAGARGTDSTNTKRKLNGVNDVCSNDDLNDEHEWAKRRVTQDMMDQNSETAVVEYLSQPKSIDAFEEMDFERTVRGRLHWIGVMKDWKWEGMTCYLVLVGRPC